MWQRPPTAPRTRAAVLFLAYKRLSLLTFTATFTVLLAAYTMFGAASAPAGIWKGFLWLMLASLWVLNVRPLRKAIITRRFMKAYLKLLQRKSTIEAELEDLKIRRQFLTRPEYAKEFERLMIELSQVSHDIRERTKS